MVKEYGMSPKIGQVYFAREKQSRFLIVPGQQGAVEYSEATAELIDHEVREIINQQFRTAKEILEKKQALLEKTTKLLLEKETIEGDLLKSLMSENQPTKA